MQITELLKLARVHKKPSGTINWDVIQNNFPSQSKQDLQNMLYNFMRSNKSQTQDLRKNYKWSDAEKQLLMNLSKQYGKDWKKINTFFTERSVVQIKNQYFQLVRKSENPGRQVRNTDIIQNETQSFHLDQFSVI